MSRGRGGGRGGGLKGATWEYDPTIKLESKPSELFPPYVVPVPRPLSEREKREVAYYIGLRDQIHKGPLYTAARAKDTATPTKAYSEEQMNLPYDSKSKADIDPFTSVPTYSMKYDQKKRAIPQLSARPFNKEFFPKELWPTLEGEEGDEVRSTINRGIRRKALILSSGSLFVDNLDPAKRKAALLEKIKAVGEDDEGDGADTAVDKEEDAASEEERDYDFEDDEAEMGGDYDGEQYFDGGEDDDDDYGDGGGGDDY